jgi:hypothetical protein
MNSRPGPARPGACRCTDRGRPWRPGPLEGSHGRCAGRVGQAPATHASPAGQALPIWPAMAILSAVSHSIWPAMAVLSAASQDATRAATVNDDLPRCATMDEHRERSTTVPSERRPGRWSRLLLAGAVLVAGAACESGRVKRPEVATTTTPAGPMVERYLTDALNLIQQHAFYAGRVDWPAVRAKAGSGPPTPPPRPEPTTPSAGYSPSSATATACCSHQSRPANSRPAAPPAAASACWRCSPSG